MATKKAAGSSSPATKKQPGGRTPQYTQWLAPEGLEQLEGWTKEGLTIEQIAKNKIGIHARTLHQWMVDHPQIGQAIKKGRVHCVLEVENALFKSAIGYEARETMRETLTDKSQYGDTVTVKERTTTRHIPPNVAAAIFILKNRAPTAWRADAAIMEQQGKPGEGPPLVINYCYVKPNHNFKANDGDDTPDELEDAE